MRKIVIFSLLCLFFTSVVASAHPPQDILLKFDSVTNTLSVLILHEVKNPKEHFIKKIEVKLNGSSIIVQKISRQDTENTQTVAYIISDANPGDVIALEAECNISGKMEKSLKAE